MASKTASPSLKRPRGAPEDHNAPFDLHSDHDGDGDRPALRPKTSPSAAASAKPSASPKKLLQGGGSKEAGPMEVDLVSVDGDENADAQHAGGGARRSDRKQKASAKKDEVDAAAAAAATAAAARRSGKKKAVGKEQDAVPAAHEDEPMPGPAAAGAVVHVDDDDGTGERESRWVVPYESARTRILALVDEGGLPTDAAGLAAFLLANKPGFTAAELKALNWGTGSDLGSNKTAAANILATKLVAYEALGTKAADVLLVGGTPKHKPIFKRADDARAAADKHVQRERLLALRREWGGLTPQEIARRVEEAKVNKRPLIEQRENVLMESWASTHGFKVSIERAWVEGMLPGRDEGFFNKVGGVDITPDEWIVLIEPDEIAKLMSPLDPKEHRILQGDLHYLLGHNGFTHCSNTFGRGGEDSPAVPVNGGKVIDYIPTRTTTGVEQLRQVQRDSKVGDGVYEFIGCAEAFVAASGGTRVANVVEVPVELIRKLLHDGIIRVVDGGRDGGSETTSARHVDKPRSPEPYLHTSDRAQLVIGSDEHTLIFDSYLMQRRVTFKAIGAIWLMSSSLRGASEASRVPWILWNHVGRATCPELIYIVDGHFLLNAEKTQDAVRAFVAQHGLMRKHMLQD